MHRYDHKKIEKKWQERWKEKSLYETADKAAGKENKYFLSEFPYPSGNLHVGHWYAFALFDIFVRKKRMDGFNVLYPIGFDAFGLPAENAAIKRNLNPREWTFDNIKYMRGQLESMGASFDWSREVITADPSYYKWTQWLFLKFIENRLAEQRETEVNWCPSCKTVLANEQVIAGECERCGHKIEKKKMLQWVMKITEYADRLLEDLESLDWPEEIKAAQRNWIGRSEGAEIGFRVKSEKLESKIKVFTTRPDTLFGATYLVLSPEHKEILNLKSEISNWDEIESYIKKSKGKSELERQEFKEKTGIELKGVKAINPGSGEEIPVWVADYVLAGYGTGAIMAVPAHDERDLEFARKFGLSIKQVAAPETGIRRDGEEVRDGGCAIVFDPETQLYAVGLGKESYARLFSGGVDDGEDTQSGVEREVREESGLWDFKYVEEIGTAFAHYHNPLRKVNRIAKATCFLIILNSSQLKDRVLEDHEDFDLRWMSADEIISNWSQYNQEKDLDHWVWFFNKSVARTIELGFDKSNHKTGFSNGAYTGEGVLINSNKFDGLASDEAKDKITKEFGEKKTTYRIRDWVISRQRYWGCPIPVIHCHKCGAVPVPEIDLPVVLPEVEDYLPRADGKSPLAKATDWVRVKCPKCGGDAERETDTLDTFIDSSWYYLRYIDPRNNKEFSSKEKQDAWMPIDFYSGGSEHTTMHLLYSRFFHKALFDFGLVGEPEPYKKRMNRGLILGPDGNKMSKSKGNVIDPDEIVERLGADTVRTYMAFIGPYNEAGYYPWDPDGVVGMRRFLERVFKISEKVSSSAEISRDLLILSEKSIKKVTEDIDSLKFNTALAQMMVFSNALNKEGSVPKEVFETFLKLLAPLAPHMAEELWERLGNEFSIHENAWPEYDEKNLEEEEVIMAVQVNGKVRTEIRVSANEGEVEVKEKAIAAAGKWIGGAQVKKVILVPRRLVNIVV